MTATTDTPVDQADQTDLTDPATDCTCDAFTDTDPDAHADDCAGADSRGWRARLCRWVRGYAHELIEADEMPERIFAALVVDYAGHARFGPDWTREAQS